MGKRNKTKKTSEIVEAFKQIQNFIKEEQNLTKTNFTFQQKKVKMPYKMYVGIKKKVLERHDNEKEYNKQNDIVDFNKKKEEKFMTRYILDRHEREKEKIKEKKLLKSRNNKRSQLQGGVMKVGKSWMKKMN